MKIDLDGVRAAGQRLGQASEKVPAAVSGWVSSRRAVDLQLDRAGLVDGHVEGGRRRRSSGRPPATPESLAGSSTTDTWPGTVPPETTVVRRGARDVGRHAAAEQDELRRTCLRRDRRRRQERVALRGAALAGEDDVRDPRRGERRGQDERLHVEADLAVAERRRGGAGGDRVLVTVVVVVADVRAFDEVEAWRRPRPSP